MLVMPFLWRCHPRVFQTPWFGIPHSATCLGTVCPLPHSPQMKVHVGGTCGVEVQAFPPQEKQCHYTISALWPVLPQMLVHAALGLGV